MTKFIVLLLFFLSLGRSLSAKTSPVILNDRKEHYEINLNFDYLEDKTGLLKIEDVTKVRKNKRPFLFTKSPPLSQTHDTT